MASQFGLNGTNVNVPDNGSAFTSSTITIAGAPAGAVVTGIDVYFKAVHPFSGDLNVDVNADAQGASGNYNLWSREGGSADNPTRTTNGINTFNGLSVNRTWYLYARDEAAGDSGYIDEWSIRVYYNDNPVLPGPTITSPGTAADTNATVANLTPTMSWNAVAGASKYGLFISRAPYGAANIVYSNSNVTGTSLTLPAGTLQEGVEYKWNMTTFNSAGVEGSVGNALFFQTPTTPAQYADLVPQALTLSPTSGAAGSSVQVRFNVVNGGQAASFATTANVRLSASASAPSASDPLLGTVNINALAAGGQQAFAPTYQIPAGTASGQKYVWVIVEPTGAPSGNQGTNTGNDRASAGYVVTQGGIVDDYPYPLASPAAVDPWNFYFRECTSYVAWRMNRDAGTTSAPYFFTNLMGGGRWSNAENWNNNAVALGYAVNTTPAVGAIAHWEASEIGSVGHVAYVESVNADGSVTISEYNYPSGHSFGTRTNVRPPRFIHVNSAPSQYADLAPQNVALSPTSVAAGSTVQVNFNVVNIGPGASTATTANVRLSSSATAPSTSDLLLGTVNVNALVTGGQQAFNGVYEIPAGTAAGQKYVWVIVEPTGAPVGNQGPNTGNDRASAALNVTDGPNPGGTVFGIDVSHHQGTINWTGVANSGQVFSFVKATGGLNFNDDRFVANMTGGAAAGMLMGAYHFAYPESYTAVAEARHFVQVAGPYITSGRLRPVLDLEDDDANDSHPWRMGKTALSAWVEDWMGEVQRLTGVEPMLYVNTNYATNYLNASLNEYPLWIANYGSPEVANYDSSRTPGTGVWNGNWSFWQFSRIGSVTGVSGDVDRNIFKGTRAELNNFVIGSTSVPEIAVSGNGQNVVDGDASPASADGTDFGSAAQGGTGVVRTFTVTNTGTGNLTLTVPPTLPAGFTIVDALNDTLAPGQSDTFSVQLSTATAGTFAGDISFINNDADESPFNFRVTGTVTQPAVPEVAVSGLGSNIVDGDAVPSPADGTDFGAVTQGGAAITRTFTVTNNGTATLTLGPVTLPNGFVIVDLLNSTLAPGQSDTFSVQLGTNAVGTFAGDVSFATNDGDESPFNFRITGTVAAQPLPEVAVTGFGVSIADGDTTPDTVDATDFGALTRGGAAGTRTFRVFNTGTGTLTLGTPTVPNGFTLTEPLSGSIPAGGFDDFTVTLSTVAAGTFADDVSITTNDADENPFNFRITGTVTAATVATATFVRTDTTTSGSWKGAYGGQGAMVIGDGSTLPAWATPTPTGHAAYTWASPTADGRALQQITGNSRTAGTWYAAGTPSFSVGLPLSDGQMHRVALYFVDYDGGNRSQNVEVRDAATNTVLASQPVSSFGNGKYLVFDVRGSVNVRVTGTGGANAVLSGIFVDDPTVTPPAVTAAFVRADATTSGNWRGVYGGQGALVLGDASSLPTWAILNPSGHGAFTWNPSTAESRVLQRVATIAADRAAGTWYSAGSSFDVGLNLTDGQAHRVALYFLDYDGGNGRSQRVDVLNAATGAVLATQSVSAFAAGKYLVFDVRGPVTFRITSTSGANAVVSGVFLDAPGATAQSIGIDTTTSGSWKGAYGAQGAMVIGDASSLPAWATATPAGHGTYTWASPTADGRALQQVAGASRTAGTWYSNGSSFDVGLNLTDGQAHRIALYFVDYDNGGRSQRVDVLDAATGAVLATQAVTNFTGGKYLTFNVSGNVRFRVTATGGVNAVLSGIFLDAPAAAGGPAATFVATDAATTGNWKGVYGSQGAHVIGDASTMPVWGTPAPSGHAAYTWQGSTADPRALQQVTGTSRTAATWYAPSTFNVGVNLSDGAAHRVALYFLDYDGGNRSLLVDVLDAATGAKLASQSVSSFGGGKYLVFNVRGAVTFRIAATGGVNAVLSGIFLDAAPGA